MSVLQSKINEIRYIRRQNLEEEAKTVGNYYRDIIRSYGVDVNYYKLKIPYMEQFKTIIDENVLLMHAYGQDSNPDYSISSDMISYMEVDQDLFQMNKIGIIPNQEVNFYFDSTDFACSLAYKLGQLKEYKVKEEEIIMEVPASVSDYIDYDVDGDGNISTYLTSMISSWSDDYGYQPHEGISLSTFINNNPTPIVSALSFEEYAKIRRNMVSERFYLSSNIFPYAIGYGFPQKFHTDIMEGRFRCIIGSYEVGKEYTVQCEVIDHGDVSQKIPSNPYIFKSSDHVIDTKEFIETLLFMDYRVDKVKTACGDKYILKGKLRGATLFRDLNKIGKYVDMIHPEIGDIVTIDFPDKENRQQFEITDCFDKQLTQDGINPLLHKYVWKCKARRYINSGEDFPEKNEGNERWNEKIDLLDNADEIIADQIGKYDEKHNDAVYGGYEREIKSHDSKKVEPQNKQNRLQFIDDGSWIELLRFHDNSLLTTDGYELFYVDTQNNYCRLTLTETDHVIDENLVPSGVQYIKSTDNALWFINFDNRACKICEDIEITKGEIELCINSLIDTTYDTKNNNQSGNYFYKFRESNTVLMSLNDNLYCRFGNDEHKLVKLT